MRGLHQGRTPSGRAALWVLLTLAVIVLMAFTIRVMVTRAFSPGYSAVDTPLLSENDTRTLQSLNREFTALAKAVTPAVVNISTTRVTKTSPEMLDPFLRDPFFRHFFGPDFSHEVPREQRTHALGSGVIVGRDGFIVTNNHVIEKASDIKVLLSDQRSLKAKVVGADPSTDIAVVKVEANDLSALPWGNSDKLAVGEVVMAVGNPFGLNQTVTRGIVSAVGRANLNITTYENFIQTDAAINPGNSGGALVNSRGELIGVNTAIASSTGNFGGVGFAIPSAIAKEVMSSLVRTGKVERGWLGVSIQPVTPELAKQFGLKDTRGALVGDATPNSPAERAGLQGGDVIVEFNGKEVTDSNALRFMAAQLRSGARVPVKVIRQGREQTFQVEIGEMPKDLAARQRPSDFGRGGVEPRAYDNALKGIAVESLTSEIARQRNLRVGVQGVIITDLDPNSVAAAAGMQPGDVITEVNRQRIATLDDYDRVAKSLKSNDNVLLRIYRDGNSAYVVLSPSE